MNDNDFLTRYAGWILLAIVCVMFLPWLGDALFNTKGEPREAIVAVSMLDSGNWILPVSFGSEIPYKPPFLAWCIAAVSSVTGYVSEYTSRLPSALACIAMVMATFGFLRRNGGSARAALLSSLILATTVEVWRGASSCRVDMVNTALMVGAMYSMYNFFERGRRGGLPWLAILLMTCAFLTKGPVGVALPCFVAGLYRLVAGDRFWGLFGRLTAAGALSCAVPALWYYAAWQRGGEAFLDLVIEENFGRLSGTMSYDSHVNPWTYNVMTVAVGMLPYTLLMAMALTAVKWRGLASSGYGKSIWSRFRSMDRVRIFAVVLTVVIFVFYCVPKSKRSVYLLPIYPMLAYFTALLVEWLAEGRRGALLVYGWVIGVVAVAVSAATAAAYAGFVPGLERMGDFGLPLAGLAMTAAAACVGIWLMRLSGKKEYEKVGLVSVLATAAILTAVSSAALPPILSSKTDCGVAAEIKRDFPEGEIQSFVEDRLLRLYEVNFYLGDRLRVFNVEDERGTLPSKGLLLVNVADSLALAERYGDRFDFREVCRYEKNPPMLSRPRRMVYYMYEYEER